MIFKAVLFLSLAVAGLMAEPGERASYSYNSASGWGPDGSKVTTGPHGVYVSGPGYYAGATSFSSGAAPNFPKFPAFPAFPTFTYPFAYANQYPFAAMQSYFNSLAQNAAALARPYNAPKPIKYTAKPYSSFSFPNFPSQQPPFSGSFSGSSSSSSSSSSGFGNPLENRFGETSSSGTVSQGSKPGFVGVFSSTSHGTSNVNGKEESFHVATTGVNENGKVTSVTVHKP